MDKKKVIELIGNVEKYLLTYEKSGKNADIAMALQQLHEAEGELSKSNWVSVDDELPPYGEWVLVGNKEYPYSILMSKRLNKLYVDYTKIDYSLDPNGFAVLSSSISITHWCKIDKLEV